MYYGLLTCVINMLTMIRNDMQADGVTGASSLTSAISTIQSVANDVKPTT